MTLFSRGLAGAVSALALSAVSPTFAQAITPDAPAPTPLQTRLFADSDLKIYGRISVEVVGQGPDLVFVPGLASSRETWRATAERLRGRFRLHLVQVAGFAGAAARDNRSGAVLIPAAEAIDAYIRQAGLKPAVYIGHSLGGTMGLYLAERHPEHFRKMMIVDAWPAYARTLNQGRPVSPKEAETLADQTRNRMTASPTAQSEAALRGRFRFFTQSALGQQTLMAWGQSSDSRVVAQAAYDDIRLDLGPDLARARVPITLVYPDNHPAGMPEGLSDRIYQTMYADLPTKTLRRIDNALHFVMWDQPEAFAGALDEFLAD